jgi:hypothetical protein
VALQHQRHRLAAQSCFADVAVAVHGTKGCSLGDFRDLKPRAPGTDRAGCRVRPIGDADGAPGTFLVRLRAPKADCKTVDALGDIGNVEADQCAPAISVDRGSSQGCRHVWHQKSAAGA